MASGGLEIERTYELGDVPLPDLTRADGVADVVRLADEELEATYYDTADLRLARTKATLRRRTGGRDAGWTLKLPAVGDARHELTAPPRGRGIPASLRALVRSRTRGDALAPVARISTHRAVCQLRDDAGRVLAEVADDAVSAQALGTGPGGEVVVQRWREVEVELVDGGPEVMAAVHRLLAAAGAKPASSQSKLARTLADRLPLPAASTGKTAGDVVLAHLREHVGEVVLRDPLVRQDAPDAVHKMRVGTRRLRGALKTFRPLLERAATDPLREELKHLAGVLGEARDAEVQRDRLLAAIDAEPVELVLGPVRQRVTDEMTSRYRTGHERVVAELDGPRYLALLERLEALVSEPPFTARAARKAAPELRAAVAKPWKQLRRAHDAADAAPTSEQRDHLLHEVRKTAKQARYAGEAVAPRLGSTAARFASRVTAVQEALGEHQDSVVLRELLRELGVHAHLAGENGFTFGRLHGVEELHAAEARRAYGRAWEALDRKKVLSWLG